MLKHYVEYFYLGILFPRIEVKEILERRVDSIDLPNGAYGFRFFDREVINKNGETLIGKMKNISERYYKGEIYTLQDVKNKFHTEDILISNMKCNGWGKVIKTCCGNFLPFRKGDKII